MSAMPEHSAEKDRPYCLRCEVPIYQDEQGTWRREATGVAACPRNPAGDGHEPLARPIPPGTTAPTEREAGR